MGRPTLLDRMKEKVKAGVPTFDKNARALSIPMPVLLMAVRVAARKIDGLSGIEVTSVDNMIRIRAVDVVAVNALVRPLELEMRGDAVLLRAEVPGGVRPDGILSRAIIGIMDLVAGISAEKQLNQVPGMDLRGDRFTYTRDLKDSAILSLLDRLGARFDDKRIPISIANDQLVLDLSGAVPAGFEMNALDLVRHFALDASGD